MCELAAEGQEGVEACALEVDRGGTSYTVDTLRAIQASRPHAELTFIVGADVAAGLPGWREPAQITRLARLAVVERAGSRRDAVTEALARVQGGAGSEPGADVTFLDMPAVEVSSSLVRERVAGGEPIDGLVPDAVAAYIAEQELYRDSDTTRGRRAGARRPVAAERGPGRTGGTR
jgi:nicotinate-nucleotide adenylyltransferase